MSAEITFLQGTDQRRRSKTYLWTNGEFVRTGEMGPGKIFTVRTVPVDGLRSLEQALRNVASNELLKGLPCSANRLGRRRSSTSRPRSRHARSLISAAGRFESPLTLPWAAWIELANTTVGGGTSDPRSAEAICNQILSRLPSDDPDSAVWDNRRKRP